MQQGRIIANGRLSVAVDQAQARGLAFDGVEILRGLSAPVRDRNWGSFETVIDREEVQSGHYRCSFSEPSGLFHGELSVSIESEQGCTAEFTLTFARDAEINRAGFCLLHPIQGVAGTPMTVLHADGREEQSRFPLTISPSQPAFDIVGLTHDIGPVSISIGMEGEVFEMEDQRNWSDASFKTYCRPLSQPRPFAVAAGQVIRQRVTVDIVGFSEALTADITEVSQAVVLPQVWLVFEPALASPKALAEFPETPILARLNRDATEEILQLLAARREVALEIVFDALSDICAIADRCQAAGLRPARVTGLPTAYLKSYQPEGPWPAGPTPDEAVAVLRHSFPGVPVGGGSLTHFTEFNRCPPQTDVDFLTFGNTAIVHAADDLSVTQTLEALPDIFASAQHLRPGKPLHLGLFSIGMRSNPYGANICSNPSGKLVAMARRDARQETAFAGAYATAVLAEAARAGVASIALAMPDGDLGAARRPLADIVQFASRHAGSAAEIIQGQGLYAIHIGDLKLVANLSSAHRQSGPDTLAPGAFHIAGRNS